MPPAASPVRFRVKGTGLYIEPHPAPRAATTGAHETTGSGRRSLAWRASHDGPNAALDYGASRLRDQSRDLCRSNTYAAGIRNRVMAHVVGTGIVPQVADATAKSLFARWTDEAAADGVTDFYGMQALAVSAVVEAGEVFIRFRQRRAEDGLSVPLQLQMLEAEHVPFDKNEATPSGGYIRQGIEFNAIGSRVAYWMYRRHPADNTPGGADLIPVRVPAAEVMHIFWPTRPGQLRGEPWLTRAMAKLKDLDAYDDAELVRKKTAAMFAGFVRRPVPEGMSEEDLARAWGDGATIDGGVGIATLEPGTMQILEPGEDIEFSAPGDVGGQYEAFMRRQLLAIAAAVGVLYEQLTGDYSQGNDRLWRAAFNEFRRLCEQWQHHMVVFQFCRPVWRRWSDMAVLSGALDASVLPATVPWVPQGWPYINPVQDATAKKIEVRGGFTSRSRVISERGDSAVEIDAENAADRKRAGDAGLVYDTDPAQVTDRGLAQKDPPADPSEAP